MAENILFLTGHLAQPRLEAVLDSMDAEFDWSGEIQLMLDRGVPAIQTDLLITEVEAATGIAEHEDDE